MNNNSVTGNGENGRSSLVKACGTIEIELVNGRVFQEKCDVSLFDNEIKKWRNAVEYGDPYKINDVVYVAGKQIVRMELKQD